MGRTRDEEFWNCVDRVDGGLKCKFCNQLFNGNPSISRIKSHLSGEPGRGIRICEMVPDDVKSKACEAIRESNKRRKTVPSSSSNQVLNPSSSQQNDQEILLEIEYDPELNCMLENMLDENENYAAATGQEEVENEPTPSESQALGHEVVPEVATSFPDNENENDAGETGQDQGGNEPNPIEVQAPRHEVVPEMATSFPNNENENYAGETGQDQVGNEPTPSEFQALEHEVVPEMPTSSPYAEVETFTANNAGETGQDSGDETFLTTELVGRRFQTDKNKILECLMSDDISSIGIYGMGGSGKTTLMKHIYNQLKENHIAVYWITVSQDFGIYRLQTLIAESIQLDLSKEREIFKRAAKLWKTLKGKQKCVLIVDDLWGHFDLEDVGIPREANGCKLVLTTRLLDVCQKMLCEEIIQVDPLNENEAWRLFKQKLGAPIPSSVTYTAKLIAKECDGLPLGIITMAGSMRGVDDICEWMNALRELKESNVSDIDMNQKVFSVLKVSYKRLTDSALQQCFLYCALYPEDHIFKRNELIEHMIDEEIIQEESMQAAFNKGHTILNRLGKACLLESPTYEYLKMHDLIRDMAIQIIKENGGVMIKAGAQVEEIPKCEKWTEDLLKVSVGHNRIYKIPSVFSPKCPKLSTLLLNSNYFLRNIPNSFFGQLNGLKVLDLSDTGIEELPNSISDLENLNALLLSGCRGLHHMPSLSKLKALKKLNLKDCDRVKELPRGIQFLSNLRHLDLRGSGIQKFPVGILPELLNLQVLKILDYLKGEELAFLRKLETLTCYFHNVGELERLPSNLNHYALSVGEIIGRGGYDFINDKDRYLSINNCSETEHFLCLTYPSLFQSLQRIKLCELKEENTAAALPSSLPHSTFSQLKEFYMFDCSPSVKKLFPPRLVSNFQNLETLLVENCEEMEEIIATEEEHESHHSIQFVLPKLKWFSLMDLPNLKSICRGDIISNSLEYIEILNCEELNRVAVSFMVPNNDSQFHFLPPLECITVGPKEWWERVELVHPEAKNFLSTDSAYYIDDGILTFYPKGSLRSIDIQIRITHLMRRLLDRMYRNLRLRAKK